MAELALPQTDRAGHPGGTLALPVRVDAHAQRHGHRHAVSLPDTLKWVEPAPLPGARLAMVHGDPAKEGLFGVFYLTFINPADDPRKK
jgi:hypothetical protein